MTDPKDGTKEDAPEPNTAGDGETSDQGEQASTEDTEQRPVGKDSGQNAASAERSDSASNQWSRRGTLPRYQPPVDSGEVPIVSSSNLPRYQVPSDLESGNHRVVDTSPLRPEGANATPAGGVPVAGIPDVAGLRGREDKSVDVVRRAAVGSEMGEHDGVDTSPFRFPQADSIPPDQFPTKGGGTKDLLGENTPEAEPPTEPESSDPGVIDTSPFRFPKPDTTPMGGVKAVPIDDRPTLVGADFAAIARSAVEEPSDEAEETGSGEVRGEEKLAVDGLPPEADDSGPIIEFMDDYEDDLMEVEPFAPELDDAEMEDLPEVEPLAPDAMDPSRTMQGLEALSPFQGRRTASGIHSAQTVELPTIAEEAKDLEGFQKYLERLSLARPGPGGPGQLESRSVPYPAQRFRDMRLKANTSLVLKDGTIRPARHATELAAALVEILAAAQSTPVILVGPEGSGKSHTCASLAAAVGDTCLLSSDPLNAFDGLTVALAANGLPVPFVIDLTSIATLGPTRPSELLTALEKSGNLPPSILDHDGPVIVIADNFDAALALGVEDYDPFRILQELIEARPNWRAVIATRPLGVGFLSRFGHYGAPVHVVEISPIRDEQVSSMLENWNQIHHVGPHSSDVVGHIPAAITGNPRLLQMLVGQWETVGQRMRQTSEKTVSGVCGLLLDSICQAVEQRTGAGRTRRDLQTLAEVASGVSRGAIGLEDVHGLVSEGFLRNELVTVLSTGVIEVRLAKGDRPAAELTFSHSLLQEILLAELVVHDMVRLGLTNNLSARTRELPDTDDLTPYNERQVLRTIEVADHHVRMLPTHLLDGLLGSLEGWLVESLSADLLPATQHFPRFLGVAWLVCSTVRRVGPSRSAPSSRLDQAISERMTALLDGAGEISLREAVMADWVVIQTARPSTGKRPTPVSE